MSSGTAYRRAFVKNAFLAAVAGSLSICLLGSPEPVSAQTTTALAIPKAVVIPDMTTGEWLPNEFTDNDSLELKCVPFTNFPSGGILPTMRLNYDEDTLYTLSDLVQDTKLQSDITTIYYFDTAHNGFTWKSPDDFLFDFLLQGSGSSPSDYKLQIEESYTVPDFDKVKANWSYGPSINNKENHVIMKGAIPISALTKYRPSSDTSGVFGLMFTEGNDNVSATWPSVRVNSGADLYLSGETTTTTQTSVDFFPIGLEGPMFGSSLIAVKGLDLLRKWHNRKYCRTN